MRQYRHQLTTSGQASPPSLGHAVAKILQHNFSITLQSARKMTLVDIGCGLGHQMSLIKNELPTLFSDIQGVDWSPATVEFHQQDPGSPYNAVQLCHSKKLPFADGQFDIALSMENLEHLYGNDSIDAIRELARIARYVLISTPLPHDCINFNWIYPEVIEAILDPIPLTRHDYSCLESAVHKSTLYQKSMTDAGFTVYPSTHGFYFARSADILVDAIEAEGICHVSAETFARNFPDQDSVDYKNLYIQLLAQSADLDRRIRSNRLFMEPQEETAR